MTPGHEVKKTLLLDQPTTLSVMKHVKIIFSKSPTINMGHYGETFCRLLPLIQGRLAEDSGSEGSSKLARRYFAKRIIYCSLAEQLRSSRGSVGRAASRRIFVIKSQRFESNYY